MAADFAGWLLFVFGLWGLLAWFCERADKRRAERERKTQRSDLCDS